MICVKMDNVFPCVYYQCSSLVFFYLLCCMSGHGRDEVTCHAKLLLLCCVEMKISLSIRWFGPNWFGIVRLIASSSI